MVPERSIYNGMSSLELVALINSQRKQGEVELTHRAFVEKVFVVLGDSFAADFKDTRATEDGKEIPCYTFPYREACLMVMSYAYEL